MVSRLVGPGTAGRRSLVAGYSLLLGLLVVPLLMRLLSWLGQGFTLGSIAMASGLLLLAALALPRHGAVPATAHSPAGGQHRWQHILTGLCLALIAARLLSLGLEASLKPVFAWDSKQHWAKQAKVFFDAGRVVPFVSLEEWLALGGKGVFTNIHPEYPITIPLLQTWVSVAVGEWHDSLVNLPWLLCYAAIGLILHGQLRAAGASQLVATAACYMLLSLPYLNVQVALPGYADLFQAACYLAAVTAFYHWSLRRVPWQGLFAAFFAAACLLVKNEGFYWLMTFVPGLVFALLGGRTGSVLLGALAVMGALLYWLLLADAEIAGHSLASMKIGYRQQSWSPILRSFFVHDNWHMLGYICMGLTAASLLFARKSLSPLLPVLATLLSAVALYLLLYLFTRHAYGAINYTSLNRVALQIVPALWFATVLIYLQLTREWRQPPSTAH